MRPHRHHDVADGARPEHSTLARHEYGLLAPEDPAGNPDAADPHGSRDRPEDTSETERRDMERTGTG